MTDSNQLYELAKIREQEYMLNATLRRERRNQRRSRLVAGVARRLSGRGRSAQG